MINTIHLLYAQIREEAVMLFRLIMVTVFSASAISLFTFQGIEIIHAFLELFHKK